MLARIYKPAKSATQSGKAKNHWVLEYPRTFGSTAIEPVMGWTSNSDMQQEVRLIFSSCEEAIDYAKSNLIEYEIITPHLHTLIKKSYSDNFTR